MTLRSDVAELLAGAGILDVDIDEAVADEHVRSSAYRRIVSATVSSRNRDGSGAQGGDRDRDRATVATILRDPVEIVAKTAVVDFVDRMATRATGPDEFRRWSAGLMPEIDRLPTDGHRDFIRRRVRDWLLYLSVEEGMAPASAELAKATNWMQRVLAEGTTSSAVLAQLAESGNTRKIRNIARNRAGSRTRRTR
ncbi:hypothetical protein PV689_13695 [Streptomyces sp. ATCC51928]|uniref:Uncharacterized protein n=1 Tax=Streptomyces caviscabies TaxID=90079 RepID=A0ABW2M2S4_9ACTN|nr:MULTISPECIES: hypothetical protein [unclassified Streptomyces]MDX3502971.1 hypothetical protein [Streptomyces sp. ATCC51928]MDX5523247.1 hypothetical protein [Streptomyces sp. DE06-01C]